MGQKTHPVGFRLGIVKDWQSKWFASKDADYRGLLQEDIHIRKMIFSRYPDAGISRINIERADQNIIVTVHTARPGIIIGRGGQRIEELRHDLESLAKKRTRLNVQEIRQPEMDAFLIARSVADQLQRRIAYRRAMRQAMSRTMQAGAQGIKIICSGRLGGSEIARREKIMEGRVPLHTIRADIDYALAEAATSMGKIGVKVWVYKGEILPNPEEELEELESIEVKLQADEPAEEEQAEAEESVTAPEVAPEEQATEDVATQES